MGEVVLMPKELTAENGAKALLIGEFHVETQVPNPDYDEFLDDEDEEPQFFTAQIAVPWDTIKKIYAKAAGHFAKPAHATDLLKACKDVLAALEKSTQKTGEILWLDHVLPGVHETAMERLQNVIDDAEGKSETCFDCGEKFDGSTGICGFCHDERDRIDEIEKTIG